MSLDEEGKAELEEGNTGSQGVGPPAASSINRRRPNNIDRSIAALMKQVCKLNEDCESVSQNSYHGKRRTLTLVDCSEWPVLPKEGGKVTEASMTDKRKVNVAIATGEVGTVDPVNVAATVLASAFLINQHAITPPNIQTLTVLRSSSEVDEFKAPRKRPSSVSPDNDIGAAMAGLTEDLLG